MKPTILFLASEPTIRNAICRALESEGYLMLTAQNVSSAIVWLEKCTPALLMVRHYTDSMSGYDAAVYLRRKCPGIPVLMVGGVLDEVGVENREGLQLFEIFPKPFRAKELLEKVKEMLPGGRTRP